MRTIYHNAESVEVWLGMDANGSRLAVQLTRELNMCQRGKASQIIRDPANAEALEALVVLFRRQYWWRIWVIQEISVAKRAIVYCGSESTPWNELDGVCDILREEEDFLQDMFYERPSFARTLLHGGPRGLHLSRYSPQNEAPPLLELLLSHKSKKSTDPKDKVFALVGISNARTSFGPIDYSRSLKDIFSHTARLIISSTRKLDIICVRQHDHITSDLPSWIPHWARPPVNFGALPVGLHHRRPEYTAAGNSLADFEFSHGGYVLKAGGFIVDTLSAVGMSFRQRGAPKNVEPVLHVFHDWWNLFVASTSNPQSTSAQSVFGRTIFCGNWAHDDKIMYEEKLKNMFELSEALLGRGNMLRLENPPFQSMENSTASLVEEIEDGEEEIGEKEQVSVAINASVMMNRRRLFVLKSGLVGLAPWDAATGDIVAILFGCRFPVILRRVGKRQGDKTYKLVGEAYIDGIMNGEAMARFQAGKYSRSEFEIH
ncbi:hypothetical protein BJ875DRAFT_506607 [Amylocarpus encephaloides]|uniref:Heterokaryon incompatibility domain-containing protein n=1 Tax=Amylocarpus encephaloides TaxID=45428 RepID=A0A9P7YDB6_9HELO|nr:hypothetical protein BJ875DRAFT_506607 [Amylocarpus encephaloides]